jgi:putative membrane protein
MMWWNGSWGWGAWLVMTITMVGFWAVVIGAIATLVRIGGGDRPEAPVRPPDAEGILAERFVRGEIDETELRDRREALRGRR